MWPFRRNEKRGITSLGNASDYAAWLADRRGTSDAGVNVDENTALRLLYVFACINVLSQTLAQMPLRLMRREESGGAVPADDHPLYDLVSRSPSMGMSSYVWRNTAEAHRQGWGNCFTKIVRKGPYVDSLRLMRPNEVRPRLLPDQSVVYDYNPPEGPSEVLSALDVIHVLCVGFDGLMGYSPIQIGRDAIGLGLAIQSSGSQFFRNGSTVKGVIESEAPPNALRKFMDSFRENFTGAQNANKTPVLPKGMTYKPVSINPDDAQTLETMKYNRSQICGLYRVPPQFIMDLERSTFTNAVEMDLHFIKHTMVPHVVAWEQELDRKLLTEEEIKSGLFFRHDLDELLRGSTKQRYDSYHVGLQDGWLTRNEVRRREHMNEIDGLSEPLVPTGMQTLEALKKAEEPPQPPPGFGDDPDEDDPADDADEDNDDADEDDDDADE